jgi:hypothetical protein
MNKIAFLPFQDLLAQYFHHPSIEPEIAQRYRSRAAVMVVDFTAMARRPSRSLARPSAPWPPRSPARAARC